MGEPLSNEMWERLNELALWIHAQDEVSAIQRGVADALASLVPHQGSMFDLCRTVDGRIECFDPVSATIAPEALATYYRTYAAQDYTTWSFTSEHAVAYRDFDFIDPAVRDTTPIYREWLEPLGFYFGMGCTIVENGVIYGSITLFRGHDDGDFTSAEVRLLAELGRHIGVRFSQLSPEGFSGDASGDALARWAHEHDITGREEEVLRLMAAGATNRDMARQLFISESTLKKHVNAVYRKLGVKNRVQFARMLLG